MNKKIISLSLLLLAGAASAFSQCIPRDAKVEAQVESLLSKLTLEEKVGQMCELAIDKVAQKSSDNHVKDNNAAKSLAGGMLSADAVADVFGKYKVGSILNVPVGTAQKPEVWADVIRTLNKESAKQCKGIPEIYGVDQIHGASYTYGATLFPQEVGQAASFNTKIPYRVGQITAYESRACLIPWVYSPVMDVARSPLWSRMWESFGEDVHLNAIMAAQLTKGLQGENPNDLGLYSVAACLKHYLAYGASVSGKDRTPSSVSYRDMMEKYFQPFRAACQAGALSIMVNSSNNNGMSFHANRRLLTEWLKEGLQWDGMIITDWADIDNMWKRDHVAANKKDAICMAINAGIDMSMDPYNEDFCTLLKELVDEGRVPMTRIDDAVRRILRLKIRCGLLDESTWDLENGTIGSASQASSGKTKKKGGKNSTRAITLGERYSDFASEAFAREALDMTEECMVLLKNNDNVLPLKKGTKIFVCGPNANNFRSMNGGWSYTWQGKTTDAICREIGKYKSFYEALSAKFGAENVTFSELVRYDDKDFNKDSCVEDASAEKKIADADVIIACIGENSYCETVGNIDDLTLSHNQIKMVNKLKKSGKKVILVLNEGRPRLISDIEPAASAIVHTFLPSNYGGEALANLLSGEKNFSARLPYTYPKYHGSFITYDCKPCEYTGTMTGAYNYDANTTVQYPFGYGLSYSDVKYSDLTINKPSSSVPQLENAMYPTANAEPLTFTVKLTNNSDREVKEPVLLYISDLVASLTPDIKRLRAFDKVTLAPHETKTVTLTVSPADLAFVNEDLKWVVEPGQFRAIVADQTLEFELK